MSPRRMRSRPAPIGSTECNRRTAALRPSTPTPTPDGSINCRSPMSRRSPIHRAPISPAASSKCSVRCGHTSAHPVAERAVRWLQRNQSAEGSWWGRWGVNHIYGTFSALLGLRAIHADLREPWIRRAVSWLKSVQNPDGGWGESCLSDKDPNWRGRGDSTASQTAWALIGLIAGEDGVSDNVCAECDGCSSGRIPPARGMRPRSPATGSRIISTCATTCIRTIFRCSRWRISARG